MPNRLEQEFPRTSWQAVPPIGPGGAPPEVIRRYMEHGRRLRSQAMRDSARMARGTVMRGLVALLAFVRCAALGLARRPSRRDCWTSAPHGA